MVRTPRDGARSDGPTLRPSPAVGSRVRLALALALLLPAAALAQQPTSMPTSAPTSMPTRAPVEAEAIEDPEDEGGWVPPATPSPAPLAPGGSVEPPTTLSLRGQLRLALDTFHEGPRPGQPGGYHEDVMELTGQALATVDHRARSWLRLHLSGRVLYRLSARRADEGSYYLFNGSPHKNDWEADLLDSYVAIRAARWLDLSAGLLTQVLGANDLVNPNDVLAPRDLRFGVFLDPETARLPTPLLRAEAYLPRGLSIAAYVLPVHSPDRIDLFGSDFALLGPAAPAEIRWLGELADGLLDDSIEAQAREALIASERPRPFADPSLAARAAWRVRGWDLSVQYAWLFERQPQIRLEKDLVLALLPLFATGASALTPEQRTQLGGLLLQEPTPVRASFARQQQAGLSVSGSLWELGLNVDLAWRSRVSVPLGGAFPLQADPDDDRWLVTHADSSLLAYTVGLSYTRGEALLLTLEGWHQVYVDLALDDDRPELLLGEPQLGGLAFLGRYRIQRPLDLSLQLLVHADLINHGVVLTPQLSWRAGDHLALLLGVNLFEGSAESLAGRLDQNDQVYLGLEGYL